MGRRIRSVLIATSSCSWLIAALAGALSPSAIAYPTPVDFDGSILRWNIKRGDAPISFEVVADRATDLSLFTDAVVDSAQIWTDVPTSYFAFEQAPEGTAAQVTVHLKSAIDGGSYSAGYALFDAYDTGKPPKPTHCSIYVAVTSDQSYLAISKTILHELGHCLGLGHTLVPEAIMSYSLDKNSYALDIDDEAAATRLYPQDGSSPKLPPGCAVGTDARALPPWRAAILLVVPMLLALRRRKA